MNWIMDYRRYADFLMVLGPYKREDAEHIAKQEYKKQFGSYPEELEGEVLLGSIFELGDQVD